MRFHLYCIFLLVLDSELFGFILHAQDTQQGRKRLIEILHLPLKTLQNSLNLFIKSKGGVLNQLNRDLIFKEIQVLVRGFGESGFMWDPIKI
jgi:hypothetical protein